MNNVRVRLPRKLAKSVSSGVLAEEGRLNPVGALGITLNMLPVHRVTMTLAENDLPLAMHDLVEVYNHKGSVGIYRVTKIPHTIRKNRKYELSHGLDVLSDATFDMIEEYKGTVAGMLAKIINAQTQMIGGVKYWRLGVCEDTNPWNKDIKYDTLMECLTEIAKKEEDYMFTFDQSTFPWTLNFIARDSTVLSEFRLNRNTENCVITEDDTDLCTRLYLSVTSETNDDEGHGTYINEGYFTYNDTDAQNAGFGVVCKTAGVNQEDFTSQAALEAWVAAYFGRHNRPGVQITIDGVELNKITGESIDEVHLSRICRVALPEYSCTFNERIVSVNYPDALRKPLYVRNSLANKRQTAEDAFSEIKKTATSASKSAGGAGRAAHNDATYFRRTIGDTANGLYSRIEQTAYYIRAEVVDVANGLYSRIEQTASYIRAEVADTANGLESKIEQTASYIRSEVADTANGLYSKIEETASYIRSEVSSTANGLYSRIEQTASEIRSEVSSTANGLNSKIDQTASYIRSEVSQTANGLSSRIDQNASQIALRVAKGDVATQLAVEAGNVSISGGNLVVDGYVKTSELDADYIAGLLVNTSVLSTRYLYSSTIECSTFIQGEYSMDVSDAVSNVQIVSDGSNGYKLQKKHFYSSTWTDAGSFSRAISSDSWSWVGGAAKVVLQPQNQTFYSKSIDAIQPHGQSTWDDDKKGFTVTLDVDDTDGTTVFSDVMHFNTTTSYDQGHTDGYDVAKGTYTKSNGVLKVSKSTSGTAFPISFAIDAGISYDSSTHKYTAKALCDDDLMDSTDSGTEAYDAGRTAGYNSATGSYTKSGGVLKISKTTGGTAFPISFSIDAAITYNSSTHKYTAKALCDDDLMDSTDSGTQAYDAGVTAGEGHFSLASVTLQGTAYGSITPTGTEYKYTYTHLYKAGSTYSYYKGNGSSVTGRGTKQSVSVCGNAVRFKRHTSSETPSGTWYSIVSSGYDLTYYLSKSEDWYPGNGSSVTGRGDSVTGTNQGDTQWAYVSDASGSVTRYAAGTAITNLRNPGSTVSNTYYTKTS